MFIFLRSLPWRGVWVEIGLCDKSYFAGLVTPLAGSVG